MVLTERQGEVEDIILHARAEGTAWVRVALVSGPKTNINTVGQGHRLQRGRERHEQPNVSSWVERESVILVATPPDDPSCRRAGRDNPS